MGKNQTKQLLFPSGLERVCDVKVELSQRLWNFFLSLFLRGGVRAIGVFVFFFKSLKQCCFPFLEAIVPGAADSLPSHSSLSWEALS